MTARALVATAVVAIRAPEIALLGHVDDERPDQAGFGGRKRTIDGWKSEATGVHRLQRFADPAQRICELPLRNVREAVTADRRPPRRLIKEAPDDLGARRDPARYGVVDVGSLRRA